MTADAAFWNQLAEKYAKKPVPDPAAFERKIDVTKSLLAATDVVLDIRCGTGSLAIRLAASAARVHGLDLSSALGGWVRRPLLARCRAKPNIGFLIATKPRLG